MTEILDWLRERAESADFQMFVPMVGCLGQMMRAYGIDDDDAPDWRQNLMGSFGPRILTGEAALRDMDFPAVLDEIRSAMGMTPKTFARQRKAFLLGLTAATLWYSREHMAPVIHDRKTHKGLKKGRSKRSGNVAEKQTDIRRRFKERVAKREDRKNPSDTAVRHRVADEMTAEKIWGNVSYRAVMEATKDLTKK